MEFAHITVLLNESVDALQPERGGIFVDCTAGGGGHSEEILKRLPKGSRLIPSVHGIFQARVLEWGANAFSEALLTKMLRYSGGRGWRGQSRCSHLGSA